MSDPGSILTGVTSLITMIIAGSVAAVHHQQYVVNRERLKLELFERRMKIYESVRSAIEYVCNKEDMHVEGLARFGKISREAVFLFDRDVEKYLLKVRDHVIELSTVNAVLKEEDWERDDKKKDEVETEKKDHVRWFHQQLAVKHDSETMSPVDKVFVKYLKFRAWHEADV